MPENISQFLAATPAEYEKEILNLLDKGLYFTAFDLANQANQAYPAHAIFKLLSALASVNAGATEYAVNTIEPLHYQLQTQQQQATTIIEELNYLFQQQQQNLPIQSPETFQRIFSLARTIQSIHPQHDAAKQSNLLHIAAQVYLKIWEQTQDITCRDKAVDFSLACFQHEDDITGGIRAAFLLQMSGQRERAAGLAHKVIEVCIRQLPDCSDPCTLHFIMGQACLLTDQETRAVTAYKSAVDSLHGRYSLLTEERRRLNFMAQSGINVPQKLETVIKAPVIVIFGGQTIDQKNQEDPIFPPHIEHRVKQQISTELEKIDAQIAYSSAASGSDILCIEAMLERGGEVNIILPFRKADFITARVSHAGMQWITRFENILKLATSVTWSTDDPYLLEDELFHYNNLLIIGKALLRAESLLTQASLLVVIDYLAPNIPGSSAGFIDQWPDIRRLHLIDLQEIREQADTSSARVDVSLPEHKDQPQATAPLQPRKIKAMLFADITHYSQIKEEELPALFGFLADVNAFIQQSAAQYDLIESWGDAIYVAMNSAIDMADYAALLCTAFASLDYLKHGLSIRPQIRIGLHMGPVYEHLHPLTRRKIIYGQHVSRAARIETITIPGEIYTSENFVAVLKAEQNAARHAAQETGDEYHEKHKPEYVGLTTLPKSFGEQAVYHLRQLKHQQTA